VNIYVASSWRNEHQPEVVKQLRLLGHSVYDFRNPKPGNHGFAWDQIDIAWRDWTVPEWFDGLSHPIAQAGFKSDFEAMKWADMCVLVLPAGRSAHLELGWAVGTGKKTVLLAPDEYEEPDLMPLMCDKLFSDLSAFLAWLGPSSNEYRCTGSRCLA
jgi:hypothetical protein